MKTLALSPGVPLSTVPPHAALAAARSLLLRAVCQGWCFSKRSLHSTWVRARVNVSALRSVWAASVLRGPLVLGAEPGSARVAVPSHGNIL